MFDSSQVNLWLARCIFQSAFNHGYSKPWKTSEPNTQQVNYSWYINFDLFSLSSRDGWKFFNRPFQVDEIVPKLIVRWARVAAEEVTEIIINLSLYVDQKHISSRIAGFKNTFFVPNLMPIGIRYTVYLDIEYSKLYTVYRRAEDSIHRDS